MKKRFLALAMLSGILLPLTASANSSWRWLSEARPYDVLPVVALMTMAIETTALWLALGKKKLIKIAAIVVIANLLSFAAPYFFEYTNPDRLYPMVKTLNKFPSYTVRAVFLFMTVAVELPIVFLTLRKHTGKKWRLLLTSVGANTVTTLITAAAERIFCYGEW